jgi:glycosyltransferase involved in cell wall biosynthesis
MIARNEAKYLANCLESLRKIVDETIVVDTGSDDQTREIARQYGARVFNYEWDDDFAKARNFSLQQANGDWILVMDADESISEKDQREFRSFCKKLNKDSQTAYLFTTRNYTDKRKSAHWVENDGRYPEGKGMGWIPTEKVRLFSNHRGIHFIYPVHELVEPVLEKKGFHFERCPVPIHHYGKLDQERNKLRWELYYEIGKNKLEVFSEQSNAIRELAIQAALLNRLEEAADLWKRYVVLCPRSENGWTNLAGIYSMLGSYQKAKEAAYQAADIAPEKLEPLYNVVISELQNGDKNSALDASKKLLDKFPDYAEGQLLKAVIDVCAGKRHQGTEQIRMIRNTVNEDVFMRMFVEIAAPLRKAGHIIWVKELCRALEIY